MAQHIMKGLTRAAVVACDTRSVREQVVRHNWCRRVVSWWRRLASARPLLPRQTAMQIVRRPVSSPRRMDAVELLHVGSVVSRKRIDVLLQCCGALRRRGERSIW